MQTGPNELRFHGMKRGLVLAAKAGLVLLFARFSSGLPPLPKDPLAHPFILTDALSAAHS